MRAVTIPSKGRLELVERPIPKPVDDQVLVRVAAAGLNRGDLWQLAGGYPAPADAPQDIPGMEFAGTVEAIGRAVKRLKVGDRVYGLVGGGAQAEFVAAAEGHCAVVPERLDLVMAGAVPEAFITAHDALFTSGGLRDGQKILIHAVGSGVGTAALQIGKAKRCEVAGTARSPQKLARARDLGLDTAIEIPREVDAAQLTELMRPVAGSMNAILDLVGGDYLAADIVAAAPRGVIVMLSTIGGDLAQVNLRTFMNKRLTLRGTMLRHRPKADKEEAVSAFARDLGPLLASGVLRPVVETVVSLDDVRDAYELLRSDKTFGKVVLKIV